MGVHYSGEWPASAGAMPKTTFFDVAYVGHPHQYIEPLSFFVIRTTASNQRLTLSSICPAVNVSNYTGLSPVSQSSLPKSALKTGEISKTVAVKF